MLNTSLFLSLTVGLAAAILGFYPELLNIVLLGWG